jgi:predicted transcriptional regulator
MKTDTKNLRKIIDKIPGKKSTDVETHQNIKRQFKKSDIEEIYEGKLLFRCKFNNYYSLGLLTQDLSSLLITLMIEERSTGRRERTKIDLYERNQISVFSQQLAETFFQEQIQIETDLLQLTDELESYRDRQIQQAKYDYYKKRHYPIISHEKEKQIIEFLKSPDLLNKIDRLIEQAGVVGEENTRKLIFIIASTYKMGYPLHSLIQGVSGSGKSHLINTIGQCFPPEDVLSMTRVTSKSFYYYTRDELVDKLLLIQDFDRLDEEAQYAFRELQSSGSVSSSTTFKDHTGNITSTMKTVKSHFASLLATTKADIYYANMSRSVVIGVDESEEQTAKIIDHQNSRLTGLIDPTEERKAKEFLQNCIRCIKPSEVVNPYADKVKLPSEAKMLRRLNNHYQVFVKQVTMLHQYQRKRDHLNRLISEPEDLRMACEILFDAIMLKVDDLDSSLRQFFNKVTDHVKRNAKGNLSDYQFTQREVRLVLNSSKTTCFRHFEDLELLEYIQRTGGYANRGFKYKVVYWDDMEKIRTKIKQGLTEQLSQLNTMADPVSPNEVERQNDHKQRKISVAVS